MTTGGIICRGHDLPHFRKLELALVVDQRAIKDAVTEIFVAKVRVRVREESE